MQRVRISKHTMPDRHWLVYTNDDGVTKHVDLSGCANNFSHATGYVSEDDLRAVGYHYEEDGQLCYELFNIGHIVFYESIKPNFINQIVYRLRRQNPAQAHKDLLNAFESALNKGGWKTVEKK